MILTDKWFSGMALNDAEQPVFITGRDDIEEFRNCKKLKERVEIYWKYDASANGMPTEKEADLMNKAQETIRSVVEKDKLAILTGVYTGNNERTMVFYARTAKVFGERLNDALKSFPLLPITIYVEKDPDWNEYAEMLEIRPFAE
ncbi:MAG: DUF695 domain-containing protein [Candidatus Aphodosoma sp.]